MAYSSAEAAFEERKDAALRRQFWRKLQGAAASIPFAEELLTAYYCAFDRKTPTSVKATLVGALAYFVLPIDAMPDFLPVLGFTDDAGLSRRGHQAGDRSHSSGASRRGATRSGGSQVGQAATNYGRKITFPITCLAARALSAAGPSASG